MFFRTFPNTALAAAILLSTVSLAAAERIPICSGFGCYYKKPVMLGPAQKEHFAAIMAGGRASPAGERAAVSGAVRYFEKHVSLAFGVTDEPKGVIGGGRVFGQMDCIDESRNTRSLLLYLNHHGFLKHHEVARNASRGVFMDRRYPHNTAVLREKGNGAVWVVDSWYEPAGGAPDIMPLSEWKKRGVWGGR